MVNMAVNKRTSTPQTNRNGFLFIFWSKNQHFDIWCSLLLIEAKSWRLCWWRHGHVNGNGSQNSKMTTFTPTTQIALDDFKNLTKIVSKRLSSTVTTQVVNSPKKELVSCKMLNLLNLIYRKIRNIGASWTQWRKQRKTSSNFPLTFCSLSSNTWTQAIQIVTGDKKWRREKNG